MSQAFFNITCTNFSSAAEISWMSSKRFRLMRSASGGNIIAVFWTTVSFRARFNTTVTDTWHAFGFIFVPDFTGTDLITQVIHTVGTTVIVWNTLHFLASATGIDGGGGLTSSAREIVVQSWAITGASTVFDVSQASENFSIFWVGPFVFFLSRNNRREFARANWVGNFNSLWTWFCFWAIWFNTFSVVTAFVS
jgi:hypothetical protein